MKTFALVTLSLILTLLTAMTKQRLALGALTLAAIPMTLIALEGAEPKATTPAPSCRVMRRLDAPTSNG